MAWNNLKLSLVNAIFPNTTKLIDAETHQDFESELIDAIGALQYRGTVIPSTNLGYIDGTAWVLAKTAGTYSNFSGQTLVTGDIAILKFDGTTWTKDLIFNTGTVGAITSIADTATVDLNLAVGVLTGNVKLDGAANNDITATGTGLFLNVQNSEVDDNENLLGGGIGVAHPLIDLLDEMAARLIAPGLWTRTGTNLYPTTTTDTVAIGTTASTARLNIGEGNVEHFIADGGGTPSYFIGQNTTAGNYGSIKFYNGTKRLNFFVNHASLGDIGMYISGAGLINLTRYTTQNFSGTPAFFLANDASGNVIQRSAAELLSDIGAGASVWTRTGTIIHQTTLTDYLSIGTNTSSFPFQVKTNTAILASFSNDTGDRTVQMRPESVVFTRAGLNYVTAGDAGGSLALGAGTPTSNHLEILATGQINFKNYTTQVFTGTPATFPAFTSAGVVIQRTAAQILADIGAGVGSLTAANNGLSLSGTTVQLGHAASGTGASDFTANRFLYTGAFDLETRGTGGYTYFDGSTGRFAIGNTAPSEAAHVTGNIRVTGAYYDSSNSAGTSGFIKSSTGTGTAWINPLTIGNTFWNRTGTTVHVTTATDKVGVGISTAIARLHIVDGSGAGESEVLRIERGGGFGHTSLFQYYDSGSNYGAKFKDFDGHTLLTLKNNGNLIGINVVNPLHRLHVGNMSNTSGLLLDRAEDGTLASKIDVNSDGEMLFRSQTGNFGFGSMADAIADLNPDTRIHLKAPSGVSDENLLKLEKVGGFGYTVFSQYYVSASDYGLRVKGLASNRLVINDFNGRVGIGETAPSQLLHVAGNVRITGGIYDSANSIGTSTWLLSSTGTGTAWVNPASVGTTYTFANGLTNTTGTVRLGGALTQDTVITGSSNDFEINMDDAGKALATIWSPNGIVQNFTAVSGQKTSKSETTTTMFWEALVPSTHKSNITVANSSLQFFSDDLTNSNQTSFNIFSTGVQFETTNGTATSGITTSPTEVSHNAIAGRIKINGTANSRHAAKSANYTVVPGDNMIVASVTGLTFTLPASGSRTNGDTYTLGATTGTLTVDGDGSDLVGTTTTVTVNAGSFITVKWSDTYGGWLLNS